MRPHTHSTPKPLLTVGGKPILGHILDKVVALGVRRIALVVGYRGDQILTFAREKYGNCEIEAIEQPQPLGLGHAVHLAAPVTQGKPVLIVYGDTVFEGGLDEAVERDADGVIGVRRVEDPGRFGVVELDGNRILRLVEKPETFVSDTAIVGVNLIRDSERLFACLDRLIVDDVRSRGEFQLTDAFGLMVDEGARMEAFTVDNWYDCGAPESLLETNRHLLGRIPPLEPREGVVIVPPVHIDPSADITRSIIGPYVSVGEDARIAESVLRDTIVGTGAHLTGCNLDQSLIGDHATVEAGRRRLNVGDSSQVSLY